MNDMAMAKYLLKEYDFCQKKLESTKDKDLQLKDYFCGRRDQITTILSEQFRMEVKETDTEYIAENGVVNVRVAK